MDDDETVLPAVDTDAEGTHDHPDGVTDAEAETGHAVYLAVDDTDDESDGLDALNGQP